MNDKICLNLFYRCVIGPILDSWVRRVEGASNIPEAGPVIIAPNHMSYLDHFLVGKFVLTEKKRRVHILTKKEHTTDPLHMLWYRLFFKRYVTMIPIDRQMGREGLRVAEEYLNNGCVLLLYPEGTRSPDGKLQKGKNGIGTLVRRTFEILPKGKFWPNNKKADISFGEKLVFNGEPAQSITDSIMNKIAELSGQKYEFAGADN